MNTVSLLVILLGNQGYWFGGQPGTISLQWALQSPPADAVIAWDLMADGVRLTGDKLTMPTGQPSSRLHITAPKVRVRTTLRWVYRVQERASGRVIERGDAKIDVFPDDVLQSLPKQLASKRLIVVDHVGELAAVLQKAEVRFDQLKGLQELQFARPDLILVAPDEIGNDPFSQASLIEHARAGASVAILAQPRAENLAGYAVRSRAVPAKMEWRQGHPLLSDFSSDDLRSLLAGRPTLPAIQLPTDEAAIEIAWWPPEVVGDKPTAIDALVVTKAIGNGRIVLWQAPLGSWQSDPRSQRVLADLLGYMTTRPEPTPPPSRRPVPRPPASQPVPTITIPPGGKAQ